VNSRRCIHRGADLSGGKVTANGLQCPYHGWVFDGSGSCVAIPSLTDGAGIPSRARIASYPVLERFGHVWTCLAEPYFDVPDVPGISEIVELDLQWTTGEPIPVDCGFMAQTENFRDVAHFPYVHETSMGGLDPVVPDLQVTRAGRETWGTYYYPHVANARFSEPGASRFYFHSYAPGIASILADYGATGKRFLINFACPTSYESCVIFWSIAVERTFTGGSLQDMLDLETAVYREDAPVISALDPPEVPLAGEAEEVSCPADAYTLNFRRATKFAVDTIESAINSENHTPAAAHR
jgi:hypothetical protein